MGDSRVASPFSTRSAWASRATAAGVGGFPLLTVLVYVADEYPAIYASAGALQASVASTKWSPEDARWHLRAPDFLTLCETHSSAATRRDKSLLTAPVRLIVACTVVGDVESASPIGADRIDLFVGSGSGVVFISYLLTGRRVGREVVVLRVVGDVEPAPTADLDGVDLFVASSD